MKLEQKETVIAIAGHDMTKPYSLIFSTDDQEIVKGLQNSVEQCVQKNYINKDCDSISDMSDFDFEAFKAFYTFKVWISVVAKFPQYVKIIEQ